VTYRRIFVVLARRLVAGLLDKKTRIGIRSKYVREKSRVVSERRLVCAREYFVASQTPAWKAS